MGTAVGGQDGAHTDAGWSSWRISPLCLTRGQREIRVTSRRQAGLSCWGWSFCPLGPGRGRRDALQDLARARWPDPSLEAVSIE